MMSLEDVDTWSLPLQKHLQMNCIYISVAFSLVSRPSVMMALEGVALHIKECSILTQCALEKQLSAPFSSKCLGEEAC